MASLASPPLNARSVNQTLPMNDQTDFVLMHDLSAADWLIEQLTPWMRDRWAHVGGLVPEEFEAHARILHPVLNERTGRYRTWREVAQIAGRTAHPKMQFPRLVQDVEVGWPSEGHLPRPVSQRVLEILAGFTSSVSCWLCLWSGFGFLHPQSRNFDVPAADETQDAPLVKLPGREYLLYQAALASVPAFAELWTPSSQSANIVWPDDRRWCLATEIDLDSTYVAGSRECINALMHDEHLEVFEALPDDPVHLDADSINPPPIRRYG